MGQMTPSGASSVKMAGDRSFLSHFNPPLQTTIALEDDLLIEVLLKPPQDAF